MTGFSLEESQLRESTEHQVARHQRVRLERLRLSCLSYALQLGIVFAIYIVQPLSLALVAGYGFTLLAIVTIFHIVFKQGWNLRFREPDLTLAQVLAPALPSFALFYFVDGAQAQAAFMLTCIVPLLYGMFGLNMRRFIFAGGFYVAGYLAMLSARIVVEHDDLPVGRSWILPVSLALVMLQIGLIGGVVNKLQQAIRRRNEQLTEAMRKISEMAIRDELTGLYNRRWLMDVLRNERGRLTRGDRQLCVCLMDIDHFKHVNDEYGHGTGDRVLAELADSLTGVVRDVDTFGRLGGEEFLWIMPDCDMDAAFEAAERLRLHARRMWFRNDDNGFISITLSMGIAGCSSVEPKRIETLLRLADDALYEAKDSGRDKVKKSANEAPSQRHPEEFADNTPEPPGVRISA